MVARLSASLVSLALALPLALACSDKDPKDPKDPMDPGPDFWLVGDQGSMFGVSSGGEASGYPLEHDEDLRAIACLGEATAWVVGSGGTVLRSRDAGQSWDQIELAAPWDEVDWTALAAAEATPEGAEALWFVGGEGAVVHTPDGGRSFVSVSGASVDFTGVATELDGNEAVAVADDGSIWRLAEAGATLVFEADAPLWAVAMSTHQPQLIAVGGEGTMLRSDDGGASWAAVELGTDRDLFAVRVAGHEDLGVAVGEGGVVVRVEAGEVEIAEIADAELGLYGLHLRHDGRGQAVGGGGILLRTEDAGRSWETVALPTTVSLRGVDDFHAGGHL